MFAYVNIFSFAFIHGYINTGLMQLGPQKVIIQKLNLDKRRKNKGEDRIHKWI